jgi:glycosyltransferase involved in cell wall biosynthesis
LIYHNVTPPRFAGALGGDAASAAYVAREELRDFLAVPRAIAADSDYNADDLREMGADSVRVMPLAIDFDQFDQRPARHVLAALRGGDGEDCVNFLTVGRLAPHKKLEDAIKVFYYFHNYVNPRSRLHIVGDGTVATGYVRQLLDLVEDLAIPNVYFTGKVRFRELLAYYKAADVYLCMSEHEGFCVPIVEAMHMGVPVIAYKQPAVAETLGSAGVLVRRKRADVIAEMANILLNEKQFQVKVVEKQRERAADFHIDRLRANLKQFVAALASGGESSSTPKTRVGDPRLLV